jgi:hypothetical protein
MIGEIATDPIFKYCIANQKDHLLQKIQEQTLSVKKLRGLPGLHDSVPRLHGYPAVA